MNKKMPWLRFIEGADNSLGSATPSTSGASPQDTPEKGEQTKEDTADSGADEVDWRAKYEEMKRHSRDWEAKAKANKGKADELDKLREAEMTEVERVQKQMTDVTAERDEAVAKLLRLGIAMEHGLSKEDADLYLHGDEEQMRKQAEGLANRRKQGQTPENNLQGRGNTGNARAAAEAWADKLLGKSDK